MQQQNKQTLSITEYARLRGLNKSTISRQVRSGQIPTRDGRIDPVAADLARERNLDPAKKIANQMRKEGAPKERKRATAELAQPEIGPTAEEILAGISKWVDRLPEIFRSIGASLPVALLSMEVILGLLYFGLGDLVDCDSPIGAPDLGAVAHRIGKPESEIRALSESPAYEAWSDAINEFFKSNADYSEGMEPLV